MRFFRRQKPAAEEQQIIDLIKGMTDIMNDMGLSRLLPPALQGQIDIEKIVYTLSLNKDKSRKERLQEISLSLFYFCSPYMAYRLTTFTSSDAVLH